MKAFCATFGAFPPRCTLLVPSPFWSLSRCNREGGRKEGASGLLLRSVVASRHVTADKAPRAPFGAILSSGCRGASRFLPETPPFISRTKPAHKGGEQKRGDLTRPTTLMMLAVLFSPPFKREIFSCSRVREGNETGRNRQEGNHHFADLCAPNQVPPFLSDISDTQKQWRLCR